MGRPNRTRGKRSRRQQGGRRGGAVECRAAIEKTPLGHIEVFGNHNTALSPPVPDTRPPHEGRCLKAYQQMNKRKNQGDDNPACAEDSKAI
jgi:hypothetical protein